MKILIGNAGSTSLKFKLYEMPEERILCTGKVERVGSFDDAVISYRNEQTGAEETLERCCIPSYTEGIAAFTEYMCDPAKGVVPSVEGIGAVGFKTVAAKGFTGVHELTAEVLRGMKEYMPVAPAHNKAYLEAIGCFREMLPDIPFIGVFETGFHRTIPKHRYLYSVPYEWFEEYGVRKFGYHGASFGYAASVLEKLYGGTGKAVICHLGGSGSVCAVENGRSVDTSFGMSLQTGLPQNNRSGDLDPYVIRYLESQGMSENAIFRELTSGSGLKGMSGVSNDLRYILDAAKEGNERAQCAVDHFTDAVLRYIGGYAAEMGGLDNLVFTGGIGENASLIRKNVCARLRFLGLFLDEERNRAVRGGREPSVITLDDSRVRALVVPADEEIMVARKTYEAVSGNEE